jgi:hypothetical protein
LGRLALEFALDMRQLSLQAKLVFSSKTDFQNQFFSQRAKRRIEAKKGYVFISKSVN